MSAYSPTLNLGGISPSRYNTKQAKKLESESVWAEIYRQQQYQALEVEELEKQKRAQQRVELSNALASAITAKTTSKKALELEEKQIQHQRDMEKQQELDRYMESVKLKKKEQQKVLDEELYKQLQRKQIEVKFTNEKEKQVAKQSISEALDSLDKEKLERERKKKDFVHQLSHASLDHEKQAQNRNLQEKMQREKEKEDFNQRWNYEKQEDDRKHLNYKMFYEKVSETQMNKMDMYKMTVDQSQKARELEIEKMINKGINDVQLKADEEERKMKLKREEMLKDYRSGLHRQVTIDEDLKRRAEVETLERDKKIHLSRVAGFPFGSNTNGIMPTNTRRPNALLLLSKSQDYGCQMPNNFDNSPLSPQQQSPLLQQHSPLLQHSVPELGDGEPRRDFALSPSLASPTLRSQESGNGFGGHKYYSPDRKAQGNNFNFLASTANRNIF